MDRFWKQFVGLGTASDHNLGRDLFFRARLKLTALYVLFVAIIVIGFSLFLYRSVGQNLRDARDDDFADAGSHKHFVIDTLGSIENRLLFADIVILVTAAGLSFILAGKTLEPIQRSVEAQKAFAANASHELRTPLAVIRNDIEVFLRNTSQSRDLAQSTMTSNLEEVMHMSSIVEDLLFLARSDNQVVSQHISVTISDIASHVLERMRSLVENRKIHLVYRPSGSFVIQGSERSLERVILNIVQNSIDHTPTGGSISVIIEKEKSDIVLRVSDTGTGIASKDLPHVFTRFYKTGSAKGTGLGLAIVKEIVTEHRGQISIESVEGTGTTVTIHFPAI